MIFVIYEHVCFHLFPSFFQFLSSASVCYSSQGKVVHFVLLTVLISIKFHSENYGFISLIKHKVHRNVNVFCMLIL